MGQQKLAEGGEYESAWFSGKVKGWALYDVDGELCFTAQTFDKEDANFERCTYEQDIYAGESIHDLGEFCIELRSAGCLASEIPLSLLTNLQRGLISARFPSLVRWIWPDADVVTAGSRKKTITSWGWVGNNTTEEADVQRLVDRLFEMLESYTLDPAFELCSGDYDAFSSVRDDGLTEFSGNFFDYSFSFCVRTNSATLIRRLQKAIRANRETLPYAEAKAERKKQAAERTAREQALIARRSA